MSKAFKSLLSALSVIVTFFLPATASAQFKRDVTIIVGSGVNGTLDIYARQIGMYLGRHLPGNPNVAVENMAGAGGLLATNYIYERAKPDGQTLYYGTWFPVLQLLKATTLKAQYDKLGVIGVGGETRAVIMRRDLPAIKLEKPSDIMKAGTIVVGSTGPGGVQDMLSRMSLDLLGVKYKVVNGYATGVLADLALQRSEIDFENNDYGDIVRKWGEQIKSGEFMPAYYFCAMDEKGNVKHEDFVKGVPCYIDLYKEIYGKMPSGDLFEALNLYVNIVVNMQHVFLAPPGMPDDLMAQLRGAYNKAVTESKFVDFFVKQTGFEPELGELENAESILRSLSKATPKEIEIIRKYYQSGGGG